MTAFFIVCCLHVFLNRQWFINQVNSEVLREKIRIIGYLNNTPSRITYNLEKVLTKPGRPIEYIMYMY